MTRHCDRPGCPDQAVSTLGYEYAQSTVWLVDLTGDSHPATYDLCLFHADSLTVPIGWDLRDRRQAIVEHEQRRSSQTHSV